MECRQVIVSFVGAFYSLSFLCFFFHLTSLCLLLVTLVNDQNFTFIHYGVAIASSVMSVPIKGEREASANYKFSNDMQKRLG